MLDATTTAICLHELFAAANPSDLKYRYHHGDTVLCDGRFFEMLTCSVEIDGRMILLSIQGRRRFLSRYLGEVGCEQYEHELRAKQLSKSGHMPIASTAAAIALWLYKHGACTVLPVGTLLP